jgi:ribosomal protein S18 acetylase RimI-like enzyme
LTGLEIVRASTQDIPFIMATERLPGNEGLVGRWERDEHERALEDPANAYFLGSVDGKPVGFVIVQHWASTSRRTLIRRIIVAERGNRVGRDLLSNVINATFAETDADWLWLNVRPDNVRAQRCYRALGFSFAERASIEEAGESRSLLMVLQRSDPSAPTSR